MSSISNVPASHSAPIAPDMPSAGVSGGKSLPPSKAAVELVAASYEVATEKSKTKEDLLKVDKSRQQLETLKASLVNGIAGDPEEITRLVDERLRAELRTALAPGNLRS